jgi:hypothetical protein
MGIIMNDEEVLLAVLRDKIPLAKFKYVIKIKKDGQAVAKYQARKILVGLSQPCSHGKTKVTWVGQVQQINVAVPKRECSLCITEMMNELK